MLGHMQETVTVTLNEDDFVETYRPDPRPRRLSRLLLLALAMAALLLALLVQYPTAQAALVTSPLSMGLIGAVTLVAVLVVTLLLAAPFLRRRAPRNTLATHPGMRDPITYSLGPECFAVRTTYTEANYPWTELWDWRESESVLIVLPSPRNFYVIPKRGVAPIILDRLRGHLSLVRRRIF
jgi:hypothetical protein